jgi:sigma-B regulation protein RsbU (phosphoserine phosphatase)
VEPQTPKHRLDSWKQIASHFGREMRTVQRWEKYEGLPVYRHLHDKAGSVYAFQHELDAWWRNRSVRAVGTSRERRVLTQPKFLNGWGCIESQQYSFSQGTGGMLGQEIKAQAVTITVPLLPRLSTGLRNQGADAKNAWGVFSDKPDDQSAVEKDLNRAVDVQSTLLPQRGLRLTAWETYYDYVPARRVGGDYCDLVTADSGDLFFFFGDAVGKGITGSMIASQLHALFRTLLSVGLPLDQMLERGNRLFCQSMATDYYATVVCGRASPAGTVELINAGHLPPFILRSGTALPLAATGFPLGLFDSSTYGTTKIQLAPGETLLFYTDGITEARNASEVEYGLERLALFVAERSHLSSEELVRACVDDVVAFIANIDLADDLTIMALRRV